MADDNQGWDTWSKHVLITLEKLEKKVDSLEERISDNNLDTQVQIVHMKAKAGIWGIVAGFVISTIVSIIIGVIVYQLTVGYSKVEHQPADIPNPTGAYMIIPQRDEQLPGNLILKEKPDIV